MTMQHRTSTWLIGLASVLGFLAGNAAIAQGQTAQPAAAAASAVAAPPANPTPPASPAAASGPPPATSPAPAPTATPPEAAAPNGAPTEPTPPAATGWETSAPPAPPVPGAQSPSTYGPPPAYYPPQGYAPPGYYPYPPPGYGAPQVMRLPPGYHQHDGFYMRLTLGPAGLSASDTRNGIKDTYSGIGATFSGAFGGAIANNLILYGELLVTFVSDPNYQQTGSSQYSLTGIDLNLVGIGPGVAYYLDPYGLYFSGTLTFTRVSLSDSSGNSNASTDLTNMGVGGSFMFGKEWWVSADWGLGAAAQLHLASMSVRGSSDTRMTAAAFSVLLSATYN